MGSRDLASLPRGAVCARWDEMRSSPRFRNRTLEAELEASSGSSINCYSALQIEKLRQKGEEVISEQQGDELARRVGAVAYLETSGALRAHSVL